MTFLCFLSLLVRGRPLCPVVYYSGEQSKNNREIYFPKLGNRRLLRASLQLMVGVAAEFELALLARSPLPIVKSCKKK